MSTTMINNNAKIKDIKVIDILRWCCVSAYIVLSFIVGQIVGSNKSRIGGILLISPVILLSVLDFASAYDRKEKRESLTLLFTYLLLFVGYGFTSSLWATSSSLALAKAFDLAETALLTMMIVRYVARVRDLDHYILCIMVSLYIVMLYELSFYGIEYYINNAIIGSRISSEWVNSNTLGMAVATAAILHTYLIKVRRIGRWTACIAPLDIIVIAASGSRKALAMLAAGIALYMILEAIRNRSIISLLVSIVGVMILFLALSNLQILDHTIQRFSGVFHYSGQQERSAQIRELLRQIGYDLFREHPLIGIGMDCARLYTDFYTGESYYLHDNYIEILSTLGLIGFVLYYWIYIYFLYLFVRDHNKGRYFAVCTTILLVHLMIDYAAVNYYDKITYVYLIVFVLYSNIIRSETKNHQKDIS